MTRISKWPLKILPCQTQTVLLPEGVKLLTVHVQSGCVCIWGEFKGDRNGIAFFEPVVIEMFGTGDAIPIGSREYIGTAHMDSGLAWHVYRKLEIRCDKCGSYGRTLTDEQAY